MFRLMMHNKITKKQIRSKLRSLLEGKRFAWLHNPKMQDVLAFLFFTMLAVAMWFTHALHSVRTATVQVKVVYEGVPEHINFEPALPDHLKIEVRDQGERLQTYVRNPLELHLDLRALVHGQEGEVRISADVIRRGLNDLLQGTSKLLQVTPEYIQSNYALLNERPTEKVLTLPVKVRGEPKDKHLRLFPAEVKVTVKVPMKHYHDVTDKDVQAFVTFPTGDVSMLDVQTKYNKPYILGTRVTPGALEFIIEQE